MSFQKGVTGYSSATGMVLMSAVTAKEWLRLTPGAIGYPKGPAASVSANGGGTVQEFSAGTVWQSGAGAFAMGYGAFRTGYLAAGGPAGAWGWPTSAATCGLVGGGCSMSFQHGTVGYTSTVGTVLVPKGALLDEWNRRGGAGGTLGYPLSAASTSGNLTTQRFAGGTMTYDAATKTITVR